jgi:ATP/maltotriose-dependent transcriptional regulator MalT
MLKEKGDNYLYLEEIPAHPTFTELTTLGLTEREAEVLGWIAQGKSNDEVAAVLGVCSQTVKKHLERIYDSLGVANRTEAALKAQTAIRQAP